MISDATGTGTIKNDEAVPTITLAGQQGPVLEGDVGSQPGLVEAHLSGVSAFTTTASWATVDGSAGAADYTGGAGTVTFVPGDTEEVLGISVTGDTATEEDETFDVSLSNGTPIGDVSLPPSRTVTILDDDARVSVSDATVDEPSSGTTQVQVRLELDHVNPRPVQFTLSTSDGTATAGADHVAVNQPVTIPAGGTETTVPVTINADAVGGELSESFNVAVSSLNGGQPGDTTGTVTIVSSTCTKVGTTGNDTITGTAGNDVICGLGGDDEIRTSPGNDVVYGGAPGTPDTGTDTISNLGKTCAVLADLRLKKVEGDCIGTEQLFGIENLTGGKGADTLRGDQGVNRIDGQAGDDVLLGDAGNDHLIGNVGTDFVSYDRGTVSNTLVVGGTHVHQPRSDRRPRDPGGSADDPRCGQRLDPELRECVRVAVQRLPPRQHPGQHPVGPQRQRLGHRAGRQRHDLRSSRRRRDEGRLGRRRGLRRRRQ